MKKRRSLYLAFLAVDLLLIVGGIVYALMIKSTFSTISTSDELYRMPFAQHAASEDILKPEGNRLVTMSIDQMQNEATFIVRATFTGQRDYGYQTFISSMQVTNVYKGKLTAGETIRLFEPVSILPVDSLYNSSVLKAQDDKITQLLQAPDAKILSYSTSGSYFYGKNMMKAGNSYLLFLKEKRRNPYLDQQETFYSMINCAYSRIRVNVQQNVLVDPEPPVVNLSDSLEIDQLCTDDGAQDSYITTCEYLESKYSG